MRPAQLLKLPEMRQVRLPARPAWLAALATGLACKRAAPGIEIAESPQIVILRAEAPVRSLDDGALRAAVCDLYTTMARVLAQRTLHPWRFWNYQPEIGRTATIGANR